MTTTDHPVRMIAPHELLFSLTDRRGVIHGANSVFGRMSRFAPDDLMGSSWNIVRHPYMPAGLFRLMWDMIRAGRPFAGYVQSMASDRVGYWAFATITPTSDGYIGVHMRPFLEDAWRHVAVIYADALREEVRAQVDGMDRRQSAELGRNYLLRRFRALGFPTYDDFMAHALPAEVQARAQRIQATPGSGPGSGLGSGLGRGPGREPERVAARIDVVQQSAFEITGELGALIDQVTRSRNLADELRRAGVGAAEAAAGLARATRDGWAAMGAVAGARRVGPVVAAELDVDLSRVMQGTRDLVANIDEDRAALADVQIRVSLAKVQADAVSGFAQDIADGGPAEWGIAYIADICPVLDATVRQLSATLRTHIDRLAQAAAAAEWLGRILARFQMYLFTWQIDAQRDGATTAQLDLLAPAEAQLRSAFAAVIGLRDLARKCQEYIHGFDAGPMLSRLRQLAIASDADAAGAARSTAAGTARGAPARSTAARGAPARSTAARSTAAGSTAARGAQPG